MSSQTVQSSRGHWLWLLPLALLAMLGWVVFAALSAPPQAASAPPIATGSTFPLTLVDAHGAKTIIPAKPQRIVPADAGTADIVVELVDPKRIAAVPFTVNDFAGAKDVFAAHPEIPRFEKYHAETLLSFNPDLILAVSFHDSTTTGLLEQRGVPVLKFDAYKNLEGIRASFATVGSAVGNPEGGIALQAQFDARLAAVEKAVAGRSRPRVLSYSNYGQGFVVGAGESQDEIIRRVGASNAALEVNLVGHINFSFEQMLKLNPDWIVVAGNEGMNSPQVQILLNESSLAQLPAMKARHIAVVPDRYYSSTSQYVVNAVEILARQLHPDAFPKLEAR